MRAWERRRLEGGRERVQRFLSAAEPVHDGATLLLCLPPEVRPLAQALGRDPDAAYQQLWSDGFLQLAPPEPELPTVHRGWLTLLASLQDSRTGAATDNRALREKVLGTVLNQERCAHPPLWTLGEPWFALRVLHTTVGPSWDLTMVSGERSCTYVFEVPDWAWEDTHLRPVRLLNTPGETWAQSAVVFCPSEVTQAELRRQVRALLAVFDEVVGRTFGLRPTAAQMAAMLGTRHGLDVTDLPLEIETHDVLCLDELARPGLDTPASRAAHP
ncbi:hypothetical protein F8S09_15785 [Deinococcus sp. SDU3-2]|uniref:Uncharacterized protein n=1 Tax=Deinococcus terrestris TaxID=2651870 RepID=A0A7X1NYL3_9DEIO|nr:hypothetical protein [Deinococcus terrestris]MPY68118.1 hypothetical protein [Deinococcus terrestris]